MAKEETIVHVHMTGVAENPNKAEEGLGSLWENILPKSIPAGTVEHWVIGKDVEQAVVDKFLDVESGDLYCISVMEKGKAVKHLVPRKTWEAACSI